MSTSRLNDFARIRYAGSFLRGDGKDQKKHDQFVEHFKPDESPAHKAFAGYPSEQKTELKDKNLGADGDFDIPIEGAGSAAASTKLQLPANIKKALIQDFVQEEMKSAASHIEAAYKDATDADAYVGQRGGVKLTDPELVDGVRPLDPDAIDRVDEALTPNRLANQVKDRVKILAAVEVVYQGLDAESKETKADPDRPLRKTTLEEPIGRAAAAAFAAAGSSEFKLSDKDKALAAQLATFYLTNPDATDNIKAIANSPELATAFGYQIGLAYAQAKSKGVSALEASYAPLEVVLAIDGNPTPPNNANELWALNTAEKQAAGVARATKTGEKGDLDITDPEVVKAIGIALGVGDSAHAIKHKKIDPTFDASVDQHYVQPLQAIVKKASEEEKKHIDDKVAIAHKTKEKELVTIHPITISHSTSSEKDKDTISTAAFDGDSEEKPEFVEGEQHTATMAVPYRILDPRRLFWSSKQEGYDFEVPKDGGVSFRIDGSVHQAKAMVLAAMARSGKNSVSITTYPKNNPDYIDVLAQAVKELNEARAKTTPPLPPIQLIVPPNIKAQIKQSITDFTLRTSANITSFEQKQAQIAQDYEQASAAITQEQKAKEEKFSDLLPIDKDIKEAKKVLAETTQQVAEKTKAIDEGELKQSREKEEVWKKGPDKVEDETTELNAQASDAVEKSEAEDEALDKKSEEAKALDKKIDDLDKIKIGDEQVAITAAVSAISTASDAITELKLEEEDPLKDLDLDDLQKMAEASDDEQKAAKEAERTTEALVTELELKDSEDEFTTLSARLEELKVAITEKEQAVSTASQALVEAKQKSDEHKQHIAKLDGELKSVETSIGPDEKLSKDVKQAELKVSQKKGEITSLESKLESERKETVVDPKKQKLIELQIKKAKKEKELASKEHELAGAKLAEATARLDYLKKELEEAKTTTGNLESLISLKDTQAQIAQEELDRTKQERENVVKVKQTTCLIKCDLISATGGNDSDGGKYFKLQAERKKLEVQAAALAKKREELQTAIEAEQTKRVHEAEALLVAAESALDKGPKEEKYERKNFEALEKEIDEIETKGNLPLEEQKIITAAEEQLATFEAQIKAASEAISAEQNAIVLELKGMTADLKVISAATAGVDSKTDLDTITIPADRPEIGEKKLTEEKVGEITTPDLGALTKTLAELQAKLAPQSETLRESEAKLAELREQEARFKSDEVNKAAEKVVKATAAVIAAEDKPLALKVREVELRTALLEQELVTKKHKALEVEIAKQADEVQRLQLELNKAKALHSKFEDQVNAVQEKLTQHKTKLEEQQGDLKSARLKLVEKREILKAAKSYLQSEIEVERAKLVERMEEARKAEEANAKGSATLATSSDSLDDSSAATIQTVSASEVDLTAGEAQQHISESLTVGDHDELAAGTDQSESELASGLDSEAQQDINVVRDQGDSATATQTELEVKNADTDKLATSVISSESAPGLDTTASESAEELKKPAMRVKGSGLEPDPNGRVAHGVGSLRSKTSASLSLSSPAADDSVATSRHDDDQPHSAPAQTDTEEATVENRTRRSMSQ